MLLKASLPRETAVQAADTNIFGCEGIHLYFVSLPAVSALLGLLASAAGRHSLRRRAVIGSAAAAHSTASESDILAWRKLHLRIHATHLLVHLADATLFGVARVGLALDAGELEANPCDTAAHLPRCEAQGLAVPCA